MRALIPTRRFSAPTQTLALADKGGRIEQLLAPLLQSAAQSDYLIAGTVGEFASGLGTFQIPRFIFMGPKGGGDTIRLGLFAAIRGDDWRGAEALVAFLSDLERSPQTAKGYHIYAYPICNPTGFVNGSRNNSNGEDIAGHFWNGSSQPEAYYLEREIGVHCFHGVISLEGFSNARFGAVTRSAILKSEIVEPALQAARKFMTGELQTEMTEGLKNIEVKPSGFLTSTDELCPAPFEINFGIPEGIPKPSQIHGTIGALKSALNGYRAMLSHGQNL